MKNPCKECPFKRGVENLGGSAPEVYLGQVNGPFWLPCHLDKNYAGKQSDMDKVKPCTGAAMLRSKLPIAHKFNSKYTPVIEDKKSVVYGNCAEFLSNHKSISMEEAVELTNPKHIQKYLLAEFKAAAQ